METYGHGEIETGDTETRRHEDMETNGDICTWRHEDMGMET
jgi:hypothetical protein